jgi:two-component system, LytTR family, sensor kinase
MNDKPLDRSMWRSLLLRIAIIPVIAIVNFSVNLFGLTMSNRRRPMPLPPPHLGEMFMVGAMPAIAWVALSIPVQWVTRRLVSRRIPVAVVAHVAGVALFIVLHSVLTIMLRQLFGIDVFDHPILEQIERHAMGFLPMNLVIYAALVAGTLAWDNWRLSVRRERTAAHLASELTRAELAALRSRMQPHFLFNALHGISSVMDSDVPRARSMMVALSHLLRSSLAANTDSVPLEQELQLTHDYLDLQQMRFEDRLRYDLQVDARTDVHVPSFILQPLVENAVIHGMADRSEPTTIRVVVRESAHEVEIDVSDDGPGFPRDILDGTRPLGVGLGALRARLQAMPHGRGSMTLRNRADGGAQVAVRVATDEEAGARA